MQTQFSVTCQRVRQDNGYFTMFFNPAENEMPSVLMNLPKQYPPCEQGAKYRFTVERVSE